MQKPAATLCNMPSDGPADGSGLFESTTDDVIRRLQSFVLDWPNPTRYESEAHFAATDTDGGFERILRWQLERELPIGDVSGVRDLGMGDGHSGAVIPKHELDLVVRTGGGRRLVIEAKAWTDEVGKEAVIVFLAKVLDFVASASFHSTGPIQLGFIGLSGFTQAAERALFAFGIIPFVKSRPSQFSFRYLDGLLAAAIETCSASDAPTGLESMVSELRARRAGISPFVSLERRDFLSILEVEPDSAFVDLHGIRGAADLFEDARAERLLVLAAYRAFRHAWSGHRAQHQ